MKTVKFMMALAAAATLASCGGQAPKANLQNDIDSLSYAIGMARTEGLDQFLMQQGVDSAQMASFMKGFNEGASKIGKKDVAYVIGLQVGQMAVLYILPDPVEYDYRVVYRIAYYRKHGSYRC